MSVKRIVDTAFWTDATVVDNYSPEDKFFLLYLMTNPHTTQIGIYLLPKKFIAFEMGYSLDTISVLIERFEKKFQNILYSQRTQEISMVNSLKYSIVKGGKPVEDLLTKEINNIQDDDLIAKTYGKLIEYWSKSNKPFDETVRQIFEKEMANRNLSLNDNDNDNDNDNEESYPDSYHDSYDDSSKKPNSIDTQRILDSYHSLCQRLPSVKFLTDKRKRVLITWKNTEEMTEVFTKAGKSDFLCGINDKKWTANFDWVIKPENRIKILEGNYDNKGGKKSEFTNYDQRTYDFDALEKKMLGRDE